MMSSGKRTVTCTSRKENSYTNFVAILSFHFHFDDPRTSPMAGSYTTPLRCLNANFCAVVVVCSLQNNCAYLFFYLSNNITSHNLIN